MGKRPKKKIVLFLVEGMSDKNAFEIPFGQLLEDIDPDILLEFAMVMNDDGHAGGDITSKNGIYPDNIERFIDEIMVSPFLKQTGLYPKDILEIVHFVDTDGVYIDDALVAASGNETDDPVYYPDYIVTGIPAHVVERNHRKSDNLDVLTSLTYIKIGSKKVKYSAYYFSCNLDHFLHGDANFNEHDKTRKALEFSIAHEESGSLEKFFFENETETTDMSYDESWDFIRSGENSLKRHTNVNLLIKRLMSLARQRGGTDGKEQKR